MMTNKFKIRHHQVTAYHPQANGLIERFNGTLKQMIAKVILGEEDWDLFIASCLFAYRTSKIEGIGITPAFLAMGLYPKLPIESTKDESLWERIKHLVTNMPLFRENVLERILAKQNKSTWIPHFQIGDQVLLQRSGQPKSFRPK